jgi:hypothetical protein
MPTTSWDFRLRALTAFVQAERHEPSDRASSPGERRLALWLDEQRKSAHAGRLTEGRVDALRALGVLPREERRRPRLGAAWLKVAGVAGFLEEEGRLPSLTSPRSAGEKRLAAWLQVQLSGQGLTGEQSSALREILVEAARREGSPLAQVG